LLRKKKVKKEKEGGDGKGNGKSKASLRRAVTQNAKSKKVPGEKGEALI